MKSGVELTDNVKSVVIGTAGHIDHGKTALVLALTGTDTDRLPEEKKRGITIDLGFAALNLQDATGRAFRLSLIDVPGHHAFIRNMLAGTGGIDAVMLVVAADEGVKAQTEEHLAICSLLGIERGVVVLTKKDAVTSEQLEETRAAVGRFLQHTFLESAPVIAVSAVRGEGIAELKATLAALASEVPDRNAAAVVRMPLDRAFTMRGFGTVVTGTLQSGTVRVGDSLQQQPAGRALRVRGIHVHGAKREVAHAPCRVALNVPGIEVSDVERGDTLVAPGTLCSTRVLDAEISLVRGAPVLKHGSTVRVHAFASETLAKVLLFGEKEVAAGNTLARLRLIKPLLLVPGDRFVLRQCSPAMTIGGGRVLDAYPLAGVRKAASREWLELLRNANAGEQLRLRVARRGRAGTSVQAMISETGLTADALRSRMAPLVAAGKVLECNGACWVSDEGLQEAMRVIEQEIARAGSLSQAELRSRTQLNAPVFALALQRLSGSRVEVLGESVRKAGQQSEIPEPKRRQMEAIETTYAKAGLAAPLLSDVCKQLGIAPGAMRELMTLLLRSKRLVRMGSDDAFVHPKALEKLYANLRQHRGESFDVGRFKTFTGLTRKHAIPLLEHLDAARVVRNDGGTRVVL